MQKWEYRIIDNPANNKQGTQITLNGLGAEGWELVCVTSDDWYIFKRPVEDVYEVRFNKKPEWHEATTIVPEYDA